MGSLLDQNPELWKSFLFAAAAIGLVTVLVQKQVPVDGEDKTVEEIPFKERLTRPWKDSYELLRKRSDFASFQWGFMLCGFGLMLIQPALAFFMVDTLGISYLEFAAAISIAKGLGFAASSPLWSRLLEKMDISKLASLVFLFIGLFPLVLSMAALDLVWLYVAYFIYGIGQGGSHLVWNLSGPTFAGKEDSARYTGVGVVLAGLRGGVAPPLGGWLSLVGGPFSVLLLGSALCVYSGLSLFRRKKVCA
jgi:Na+/melibiose symporter-like transporter